MRRPPLSLVCAMATNAVLLLIIQLKCGPAAPKPAAPSVASHATALLVASHATAPSFASRATEAAQLARWYAENVHLFDGSRREWRGLRDREGQIMLDIGANTGIFAHGLLQKFPLARVVAFEPIPRYADFIRGHALSQTDRLTVECLALGNDERLTKHTLRMDKQNLGWNTLVQSDTIIECAECMERLEISSVAFDTYNLHARWPIESIVFVKIDVEGYEFRVLQGMRGFLTAAALAKRLPLMLIEIAWGPSKHPHWAEEAETLEWLISLGYHRPHYEVASTRDVWFVPLA